MTRRICAMSEQADDLTTRMFTAANIIDEVRCEYAARNGMARPSDSPVSWSAHDLRTFSDRWDREDAEKAAEAAAIEELAKDLYGLGFDRASWDDQARQSYWRDMARELYGLGYRRGGA